MRNVVACFKIFLFGLLCLITIPLQGLGWLFLQKSKLFYVIPILFHSGLCAIFRIRVNVVGAPAQGHVIFVGNHLSYIDIPVIGSKLNATFISKADVRHWPILGTLAALAKTIFIERSRNAVEKCIADIRENLGKDRSLILFPEGTSTNGVKVLFFKSTIFELFLNPELKEKLIVQPFTMTLTATDGQPLQDVEDADIYCWYGDMDFGPHIWQLAKSKGAEITMTLHPPFQAKNYENRKIFAQDCHKVVASGLSATLPLSS